MKNCAGKYEFNGVTITEEQLYELQLKAIKQLEKERRTYLNDKVLDPNSIIEALKQNGFINIRLFKGKYLRVPRGRFASDKTELQSLREIEFANQRIKDRYGISDDVLVPTKTEHGYNIVIDEQAVKEANYNLEQMQNKKFTQEEVQEALSRVLFERDGYMEQGADPNTNERERDEDDTIEHKVNMILVYKKSLLALMKTQLSSVESKLRSIRHSNPEREELLRLKDKLHLRIYGNGIKSGSDGAIANLTDEIKDLESSGPNVRHLALSYMIRDLTKVEELLRELEEGGLTEKHLINLTQIQLILSPFELYEQSLRTNQGNPLFTNAELKLLRTGQMTLGSLNELKKNADAAVEKVFSRVQLNYMSRFYDVQKAIIERIATNDDRVKELFGEDSIKYSKMFGEAMKDLSTFDKFFGDNVVGTFTNYGPVPQIMRNLLERVITKYMSKHTVWEEEINKQQKGVHEELQKLGYGLGPEGILGVNYKLFRQTLNNVKLDGNKTVTEMTDRLVQRHSHSFATRIKANKDAYWETIKSTVSFLKRQDAYLQRNNWLRKNTVLVDPRKLSVIRNNPDFQKFKGFFIDDDTHETELKKHLNSEIGLKDVIDEQERRIYDYLADYNRFEKNILAQAGVDSLDKLNVEYKRLVALYDAEHNPFLAAKAFSLGTYTKYEGDIKFPEMSTFNSFVPRRFAIRHDALAKMDANREIYYDESDEDTGYYDKNFSTIENNPVLKKFYDLTKNLLMESSKMISPEMQEDLKSDMFNSVEKTFGGILLNPDVHVWQRIIPALKKMYDNIKESIRSHAQSQNTGEVIDPFTTKISHKIKTKYIKTNKAAIETKFRIQSKAFVNTLNDDLRDNFSKNGFIRSSKLSLDEISPKGKEMLASWLGVKNNTGEIMHALNLEKTSDLILVGRLLNSFVTSQIVADETFNLPKILKLYSQGATNYAAMNEALPMINVLKDHYENITKPALTNAGEQKQKQIVTPEGNTITVKLGDSEKRMDAVANMNKWYQRNVIGNIESEMWGRTHIKTLTSKEKEIYNEAQAVIDEEYRLNPDTPNMKVIQEMTKIQSELGGEIAISAFVDQALNFSRWIGLGVNPVSAIKNYMAGKLSNFISGLTGYYYTEDSMWRAEHAILSSHANLGFGIAKTKGARKIALLMTRFKVFQDATDEIYKSSINGAVNYQSNLSWYFLQQRVEYVNQAPVLIAMLMDKKIQSMNRLEIENYINQESAKKTPNHVLIKKLKDFQSSFSNNTERKEMSVWDAMKNDGTFIEGFNTDENNRTWVNTETTDFTNFKSRVDGAIKNIHGDYTTIGAPANSNEQVFRAIMMFKRWAIRYFHTRLAEEHFDSELGVKFKGRFRNYNTASLSAVGVTMAVVFTGINLPAIGIGLGAGAIGGAYLAWTNSEAKRKKDAQVVGKTNAVDVNGTVSPVDMPKKDKNVAQNYFDQSTHYLINFAIYIGQIGLYSAQILTQSVANIAKIPVNIIVGRNLIKNASAQGLHRKLNKLKGINADDDIQQHKDIQANLTEISFMLTALMMRLILMKGFKMDDDDDEEQDTAINTLLNMAGALINEISQFYNPITLSALVTDPACIRLSENAFKFVKALTEFNEIYTTGPYNGRRKVGVLAEKVLIPAAFRTKWGFETQGRQVYDEFAFEDKFVPLEKRVTSEITQVRSRFKAVIRKELTNMYGSESQVLKEADKIMKQNKRITEDEAINLASKKVKDDIEKVVMKYTNQYSPTLTGYKGTGIPEMVRRKILTDNPNITQQEFDKKYPKAYEKAIEQHLQTVEEAMKDGTLYNDIKQRQLPQLKR